MKLHTVALSAIAMTMAVSTGALAQNASLNPISGNVRLGAGFTPDPYRIDLVAGGTYDASNLTASLGVAAPHAYIENRSAELLSQEIRDAEQAHLVIEDFGCRTAQLATNLASATLGWNEPRLATAAGDVETLTELLGEK